MRISARATIAGFLVAAVGIIGFVQSAEATASIGIDFAGSAVCLPGCSGSSGSIDFGAGAVSDDQGLVVNSDTGSANFVVTNPGSQLGDLSFNFDFIADWQLGDPSTEGDRATYSLSVEDAAGHSLFSIAQVWTCGLLSGGGPCTELFDDILSFDIYLAPESTNDISVSFSAEADALSVPEPVSMSIFAAGLVATFGARTRRRHWPA
jgi:hypothetical protein